jgi:hypothetical protein
MIQKYGAFMTRNETETLDGEANQWTEIMENLSPKDPRDIRSESAC